ncbi:hypothetical protein [Janthinobacterium sp.]|uniref:hypothetical protein n=1 Tax=Janthinobacterium sp. TaxID=1871054 RepID=UPI00293D7827|nr:hypothetical protein [Janthinobacterium sp.]
MSTTSTSTLPRRLVCAISAAAAVLAAASAAAQAPAGQGLEERLRAQLRLVSTQLQQTQNELATLKSGAAPAPAAPAAAEALKKELAHSQAQLAQERAARGKLGESGREAQRQAQAQIEKSLAQVAQFRAAYDEVLKRTRGAESQLLQLRAEAGAQGAGLQQCEAKNGQLYSLGQDILRAYETLDVGSVLLARQPFAAGARVRFEQIAQQYGDKLYEARFDARAASATSAASPADTGAANAPDGAPGGAEKTN